MDLPGSDTIPDDVDRTVTRFLARLDRVLPGRVTGLYLVGSVALGAYRPGRSDIDVVAVLDVADGERLPAADVRRLRAAHLVSGLRAGAAALAGGHLLVPGAINGVFVRAADLGRPVTAIEPLASQAGTSFRLGQGFDVNPVQWTTFARHGVTVRGPEPAALGLDREPERLAQWNLDNLARYWVPWAERSRRRPGPRWRVAPGWSTAWGVLGAPRPPPHDRDRERDLEGGRRRVGEGGPRPAAPPDRRRRSRLVAGRAVRPGDGRHRDPRSGHR